MVVLCWEPPSLRALRYLSSSIPLTSSTLEDLTTSSLNSRHPTRDSSRLSRTYHSWWLKRLYVVPRKLAECTGIKKVISEITPHDEEVECDVREFAKQMGLELVIE